MDQEKLYSMLDKLTKQELIGIIIENGCFISEEWVESLRKKEINIPFDDFRKAYNYKNGSKANAKKKRERLANKEREDAMKAVEIYVKNRDPNYICMATTWINQKRWEGILEEEQNKNDKLIQQQKEEDIIVNMPDWI